MAMKWAIAMGALFVAGASRAQDAKLCALMGGGLSTSFQETPPGDLSDLIRPRGKACGVCVAGVGHIDEQRYMGEGLCVRVVHFESDKGAQEEVPSGAR